MNTAHRRDARWALALVLTASSTSALAQAGDPNSGIETISPSVVSAPASPARPAAQPEAQPPAQDLSDIPGTFLLSNTRLHDDGEILWPGFLSGLRGFEDFYEPVGMPIYFESPFNNTSVRFIYLHHEFPDGSALLGGDLNVYAVQARVAITERLGLIATKDGYSDLNATLLPNDEGWNDIAAGLKYVFIADRENDFVLTGGFRWEWSNGNEAVLQGGTDEYSPFISVAKGFGPVHLLGSATYRIPEDGDKGNQIFNWSVHADWEFAPDTLPGFAPLVEVHGNHYLDDGKGPALGIGGLDYSNLGFSGIAGNTVVWAGVGARWKLSPHASIGGTYEFPLTDADDDIMDSRITLDLILTY